MDKLTESATLLHVIDKARQWPNLKALHDMAMQRLERLQVEMVQAESHEGRWGPAGPPVEMPEKPFQRRL